MTTTAMNKNFDETVLQAAKPVVVDFWAPWCGYCRRLSPAIDRMAEEHDEALRIVKLNIDEEKELTVHYGIEIIPTLMLFKGGEVIGSMVNPESQEAIEDWLKENGAL